MLIPANVRIIAVMPVAVTFPITATCMTDTRDCRNNRQRVLPAVDYAPQMDADESVIPARERQICAHPRLSWFRTQPFPFPDAADLSGFGDFHFLRRHLSLPQ